LILLIRAWYAVYPATMAAAPSSKVALSGILAMVSAFAVVYSAKVPCLNVTKATLSPFFQWVPLGSSTTPVPSQPGTSGNYPNGICPRIIL